MNRFSLALVFGLCVSGATSTEAAIVYSQTTPSEPRAAFGSSDNEGGQKVADNFVLEGTAPITVRSLRFLGGYGVSSPPPITPPLDALPSDNFRVVFLEDVSGVPGTPLIGGDFRVASAFSRIPTDGSLLNGVYNPIELILNLGDGISLNTDTEYWVSITNNVGPNYGWLWARAEGVADQITAGTRNDLVSGPWDTFVNGGMFFELNDHEIPEPTSYMLLTVASVIAASIPRRHTIFTPFAEIR